MVRKVTLENFEKMNFVLDAAVAEQLLLVDAHQGVAVDAGVEHVVRVHRVLLTESLKGEVMGNRNVATLRPSIETIASTVVTIS